jgi:hypothetical protein
MTDRMPRRYSAALIIPVAAYLASFVIGRVGYPSMKQERKPDFDAVPLPAGAIELKLDFRFPEAEGKGPYLSHPQGFALAPSDRIYISDAINNEIYAFDSNVERILTFGRTGQGPGDLSRPLDIAFSNGKIIVRDAGNRRFQFFDPSGKYLSSFKISREYQTFAADDKRIYAAALVHSPALDAKETNLIDILDFDGHVLRSFGTFLDVAIKHTFPFPSEVTLVSGGGNELWIAFKFFPIVRKYTVDGKLLAEYRYHFEITEKKEAFNIKSLKGNAEWLALISQGAFAAANGLYLIDSTAGHRLLILFMSNDGQISESYWAPVERSGFGCNGLIVQEAQDGRKFYVLNGSEACVDVYSVRR